MAMEKDKRGWIRIVEATVAILLIVGVSLIIINQRYVKDDMSEKVYEDEAEILKEIQLDNDLRNSILTVSIVPIESGTTGFPTDVIAKIDERTPAYLDDCWAKICEVNENCYLDNLPPDKDVYAHSVIITVTQGAGYSPKQLKLFCWVK